MMRALSIGILCILSASFAHAQVADFGRELDLTLSPEYPGPGETVRLSVQTAGLDLNRSTIVWIANEKEVARGVGITETSVIVGQAGTETLIRVIAEDEAGLTAMAEATIRPSEIDILWEADSYVPPFYEGRVLPGSSSTIRLQALARFRTTEGTLVPESDIIYTWYRNNAVAAKGRGRSSVTLPGPALFSTDSIRVVATSANNAFSGSANVRIPSTDPFPMLYENHPLFGILFHRAIVGSANTLETEQKLTAVPYFAGITSLTDPSLSYEWHVGGVQITPDEREPNTLTLAANGYNGPADISLSLTSISDFAMRAAGKWQLVFGARDTSFFGRNPFGSGE